VLIRGWKTAIAKERKAKTNHEWTLMDANKNGSNSCSFVCIRGWKTAFTKERKKKQTANGR
jgi:hypothetical protein